MYIIIIRKQIVTSIKLFKANMRCYVMFVWSVAVLEPHSHPDNNKVQSRAPSTHPVTQPLH